MHPIISHVQELILDSTTQVARLRAILDLEDAQGFKDDLHVEFLRILVALKDAAVQQYAAKGDTSREQFFLNAILLLLEQLRTLQETKTKFEFVKR
jgi:hypothetical protein